MERISDRQIALWLAPYLRGPWGEAQLPPIACSKLATYLALLIHWNARTNLSAIRTPEEIVRRHFGESLFAGLCLSDTLGETADLLDLGSGAGFPGLPIQLLRPAWRVTLGESQGKKVAFLRELIRELELPTEVWPSRVEAIPAERRFDGVTLRAVDRMGRMLALARERVRGGGVLLHFASEPDRGAWSLPVPGRERSVVVVSRVAGG